MPLTDLQEAMRQKCELVQEACKIVQQGVWEVIHIPGIEEKISVDLLKALTDDIITTLPTISNALSRFTTAEAFENVTEQTFKEAMSVFNAQLETIAAQIKMVAAEAPKEEIKTGQYGVAPSETKVLEQEDLLSRYNAASPPPTPNAPSGEDAPHYNTEGNTEAASLYNTTTEETSLYNTETEKDVPHYNTSSTSKKVEIPQQQSKAYGSFPNDRRTNVSNEMQTNVYGPIPRIPTKSYGGFTPSTPREEKTVTPSSTETTKEESPYGGFTPSIPREEKTVTPTGTETAKEESPYGHFRDFIHPTTTPGDKETEAPPTVSAIPSTAKAMPNLDKNYENILRQLIDTQKIFTSQSKDKVLTKSFETLIALFKLSGTKGELTTEPQLTRAKQVITQLSQHIERSIQANKKISEQTKNNFLDSFADLSKEAVDHLDARQGRMLGFHAEYYLVPYEGDETSYRSTLDDAIKKHFPQAPATSGQSFATTQASAPSQSTEALDDKHYRVGKMANGAILTDRVENRQARTELVSIPEELNPELMWKKTYQSLSELYGGKYILPEDQFNNLTKYVMDVAKTGQKDIDEKDIRNFLMHQGDGNAKEHAKEIFDKFSTHYKPYHKTKYGDFPNDKLIAIAIQQVESRREADRSNPNIVLTTAYSPAYAKAIELYSRAMNYTFVNESEYRPKIDKAEVKAFLKLLEKAPEQYHYNDTHRLSAIAEKVIPEMKASPPIKGH